MEEPSEGCGGRVPPRAAAPEDPLADARGLQRAACLRSGALLLSPVVMVQEAAHDDKTVAFLLAQSLHQRQEEDAAKRREEEVRTKDAEERKEAVVWCGMCTQGSPRRTRSPTLSSGPGGSGRPLAPRLLARERKEDGASPVS